MPDLDQIGQGNRERATAASNLSALARYSADILKKFPSCEAAHMRFGRGGARFVFGAAMSGPRARGLRITRTCLL